MATEPIRVVIDAVTEGLRRGLRQSVGDVRTLGRETEQANRKAATSSTVAATAMDRQAKATDNAADKAKGLRRTLAEVNAEVATRKHFELDTGAAETKVKILQSEIRKLDREIARTDLGLATMGGAGGRGGGGGNQISGFLGGVAQNAVLASPAIMSVAGSLTALAGSAGAAVGGAGAIGAGGIGALVVGLGSIAPLALSARDGFKKVDAALYQYRLKVDQFGRSSAEATKAQAKLHAVIKENGGQAMLAAVKTLDTMGERYRELAHTGADAMRGLFEDTVKSVDALMPAVARIANQVGPALQKAFSGGFGVLRGGGFRQDLAAMGETFAKISGPLIHGAAEGLRAFGNIARASAPFVIEFARGVDRLLTSLADKTSNTSGVRKAIAGLVGQTRSWFRLLTDTGKLLYLVLAGGAKQGQGLVDSLDLIVRKTNAWLGSTKGQDAMRKFFRDSIALTRQLITALAPLIASFLQIARAVGPAFTNALKIVAKVTQGIADLTNQSKIFKTFITTAFTGLALYKLLGIGAAIKGIGTLRAALGGVEGAAGTGMLGKLLSGGGGAGLLVTIGIAGLIASRSKITTFTDFVKRQAKTIGTAFETDARPAVTNYLHELDKLAKNGGPFAQNAKDAAAAMRAIRESGSGIEEAMKKVQGSFATMRNAGGKSLRQIQTVVGETAADINIKLGTGSAAAEAALAQNFDLARGAIQKSMDAGVISTQRGMEAINAIVRKELALFGITGKEASSYIAGRDTTGKNLPGHGGASKRGGAATGYLPGSGTRDTVPIMAAPGEAVVNRHQQGFINAGLQAIGIGGLPDLFSKVKTPHYMASGGMVPEVLMGQGMGVQGRVGQRALDEARTAANAALKRAEKFGGIGKMIRFADRLGGMHIPYGPQGHGGWDINKLGEDCSSTVSKVLHAAGLLSGVETTVSLPGDKDLVRGPGQHVTVHDRPLPGAKGHTIVELKGRFFGTGASNPGGGPGWLGARGAGYLSTLPLKLHPKGMARGGFVPGKTVTASTFGGPDDSSAYLKKTASGVLATKSLTGWAELSDPPSSHNWSALAHVFGRGHEFPLGARLPITYNGRTVTSPKVDRGEGGGGLSGHLRAVDLSEGLRRALHFPKGGLANVIVGATNGASPTALKKLGKRYRYGAPVSKAMRHHLARRWSNFNHLFHGRSGFDPLSTLKPMFDALSGDEGQASDMGTLFDRQSRLYDQSDESAIYGDPNASKKAQQTAVDNRTRELTDLIVRKKQEAQVLVAAMNAALSLRNSLDSGIAERSKRVTTSQARLKSNRSLIAYWQSVLDRRGKSSRNHQGRVDPKTAANIRAKIAELHREDSRLAGKSGIIPVSQTGLSAWRSARSDLNDRLNPVTGLMGQVADLNLDIGDLQGQLGQVKITSDPSQSSTDLADALQSQNDLLRRQVAIQSAGFDVFRGFAPMAGMRMVGSFAHGTDYVRETGMALIHKGEQIVTDPAGPYGRTAGVAPGPMQIELTIHGDDAALIRTVDARINGKAQSVVSRQTGRQSRLIARAAGGR